MDPAYVGSRRSSRGSDGTKLQVGLTENFKLDSMPVPHRVEALYTALCDRLSLCALMILKVSKGRVQMRRAKCYPGFNFELYAFGREM